MPEASLPQIGLGTYENTDPDQCARAVKLALDAGYRHVDTAETYDNETAVGEGLAAADVDRDQVVLATKLNTESLEYDEVFRRYEQCCDRLGVDVVDVLYIHWPLGTYDPVETLAAFDDLSDEGYIGDVGLSNFTPELLDEALDHLETPLFAHQVECHPLWPQPDLRRRAREDDHYLVAYSPLAKGNVTDVPELVDVAERHDATPAQVSLAWLLSLENVRVIPKATSEEHVLENLGALELELTDEDVERIESIDRRERVVDFDEAPWN